MNDFANKGTSPSTVEFCSSQDVVSQLSRVRHREVGLRTLSFQRKNATGGDNHFVSEVVLERQLIILELESSDLHAAERKQDSWWGYWHSLCKTIKVKVKSLIHVRLFATPRTVAY